ncbi:MAG: hypothetical protein ACXV75_14210 [Candidatus Angelobacter sp.]
MESANLGKELQPGDVCTQGGAYEVTHWAHRGPHTVVVRKGEILPRCNGCGDAVRFRFISGVAEDKAPEEQASADPKRKRSAGQGS